MIGLSSLRFLLIFLFLGLGFITHFRFGIEAAWLFYAGGSLLLITHLFFGDVWLAFRQLQHGQVKSAKSLLARTALPKLLVKRNRAYYNFGKGLIALHEKEMELAKTYIMEALKLGLFRANDRALAQLNLAHLYYVQQDYDQARQYLEAAKSEKVKDLMLQQQLEKLEQALPQNA